MKKLCIMLSVMLSIHVSAQHQQMPDKQQIMRVMMNQQAAWNDGNLEGYMDGYWKSDSLAFIGKKGITRGWQQTLDNYKKSYPDKAAMGTLKFEMISVEVLSKTSAYVVGKWGLKREESKGDLSGYFTLLFQKKNNRWVIVNDHSSYFCYNLL